MPIVIPSQVGPVKDDDTHTHSEQGFLRYPFDFEQLLSLPAIIKTKLYIIILTFESV